MLGCRVSSFDNEAQLRTAHRRSPWFGSRVQTLVCACRIGGQPPGEEILFSRVRNVFLARSLALSFSHPMSLYLSLYLSIYLALALARSRCLCVCRAISPAPPLSLSLSLSLAPYGNAVMRLLLLA